MMFSKSDLPILRWSLLAMGLSVLLSAVLLYGSGQYADESQKNLRNAQNQVKQARNSLTSARDDQENMTVYADEYAMLQQYKVIGDDQRLDWMEGLKNLRQQNLVTDFRYTIAPQKAYIPQPPFDSGNFDIRYSEMKLQFDLLHEGQLMAFLTALRSQIKGWYQLEGCKLLRTGVAEDGTAAPADTLKNLTAECHGGWITLKNRNDPQ
ncbi:MAG: hypothetical protein IPM27_10165 [Nitrosomonadales bacterium]|nr:hypothetical protein [Nitrosomonadales bacterium]